MNPGDHTPGPRVINPGDQAPGSHFQAEKRKMEPELGDVSGLNNPSKIPKIEPKTPGSPGMNHLNHGGRAEQSLNISLGMSGGSVKVEVKEEPGDGDLASVNKMPPFSSGSLNKSNPSGHDSFLLEGSVPLTTEQPLHQTPVEQKDKQQKIRTVLEASVWQEN